MNKITIDTISAEEIEEICYMMNFILSRGWKSEYVEYSLYSKDLFNEPDRDTNIRIDLFDKSDKYRIRMYTKEGFTYKSEYYYCDKLFKINSSYFTLAEAYDIEESEKHD